MNIKLEPLTWEDVDQVFELTSNPDVAKYMRFDTHQSRSEAGELVKHYIEGGSYGYKILPAEEEKMIGVAAMKPGEGQEGEYSVSVFLSPEYWGKGCSTQAITELKRIALDQGIRYLSAYVVEENIGSRKVMDRCGFTVKQILHFDDMDSGLYVYWYETGESQEDQEIKERSL